MQLATELVDTVDDLGKHPAVTTTHRRALTVHDQGLDPVPDIKPGGDRLRGALDGILGERQFRLRIVEMPGTVGRSEHVRPAGAQRVRDVSVPGSPAAVAQCSAIDRDRFTLDLEGAGEPTGLLVVTAGELALFLHPVL